MKILESTRRNKQPARRHQHGKVGNQCMIVKDKTMDRPVRKEVRKMDAIERENGYLSEKSGENYEALDKEARIFFPNGLSSDALK